MKVKHDTTEVNTTRRPVDKKMVMIQETDMEK